MTTTVSKSQFGCYAALFIDLLGQSNELSGFPKLNEISIENLSGKKEIIMTALMNTAGRAIRLSNEMEEFANSYYSKNFYSHGKVWNSKEFDYEEYKRKEHIEVEKQYFSDTIVFYFPLFSNDADGRIYLGRLMSLFYTAMYAQLVGTADDIYFRGAIDIGLALRQQRIGIYGPLLHQLHNLESKRAKSPRIIIGDYCLALLRDLSTRKCESRYNELMRVISDYASRMLCKDIDDEIMIDYLGDLLWESMDFTDKKETVELISKGYHNTYKHANYFKERISKKLPEAAKLYQRYLNLLNYIKSRREKYWNIKRR